MVRKRYTAEQIIRYLRQAEVLSSQGRSVSEICREIGVTENTYYRCPKEYGKLRDELLNREIFYSLKEAQILIEQWRRHYNEVRPHSSLGYRPPAPQVIVSGNETKGFNDGFLSIH